MLVADVMTPASVTDTPEETLRASAVRMWDQQTAYRKNLKGVIQAPAYLMWNVEKT